MARSESRASSATERGDRLDPCKSSRVYWHLTALRREIESVIAECLVGRSRSQLVDFGCGNMPYRSLMEHSVAAYTGCDFPGNELADQPIDEADHLPFASETVDVVLSTQVLEHVANPARYLREAHRVLGRDGLLILSTHGTWRYHPDPTDFWRWTAEGLKRQIETEGFQIERLRGVMGPAATALQLWQDAVSPRVHPRLRRLFQRFMQFLIRRADLRCPTEVRDADACVYVVVARKLESHAADRRSDESR